MDRDLDVGITIDVMGVLMSGRLTKGKSYMVDIPQMETPDEMGMDDVGPMTLRDNNVDITQVPL
jgi:hypothetical protein